MRHILHQQHPLHFLMARYSKIVTPAISFLQPFTPLRSWKLDTSLFRRLSSTSSHSESLSALSRGEFDIKYNWIDGAESLEDYMPGGYHRIMIGDILHDRYRIVDKLGFGGYSTVWLARDTHLERFVAVKVSIATSESDSDSNSLLREIKSLRALSAPLPSSASIQQRLGHNSIPCLLDEFEVHGPNGTHVCYTTAPARCNLGEVSFSRLFNLEVARALVGGLTLALAYIHSQGYVHGGLSCDDVFHFLCIPG
jgi:hypothetical protein